MKPAKKLQTVAFHPLWFAIFCVLTNYISMDVIEYRHASPLSWAVTVCLFLNTYLYSRAEARARKGK